ncbi:hypothetical protein HJG60_011283 [Phyllostomus discolor]|uniref:Peptidase M10 metallopeptidase domain-containing protein n=1 Tax=Phyllostomus discolor TaxID=89673 RepID=A0A834E1M0_9CHIR|nr:hypothetical protein HJG60_011283 [Phyllostomus discolor]
MSLLDIETNLFLIAAHELGHPLPLHYSANTEALRYPIYNKFTDLARFHLSQDDVNGIQSLYGPPPASPDEPVVPTESVPPETPAMCDPTLSFDAASTRRGEFLFFKDRGNEVQAGYPRDIHTHKETNREIDAAVSDEHWASEIVKVPQQKLVHPTVNYLDTSAYSPYPTQAATKAGLLALSKCQPKHSQGFQEHPSRVGPEAIVKLAVAPLLLQDLALEPTLSPKFWLPAGPVACTDPGPSPSPNAVAPSGYLPTPGTVPPSEPPGASGLGPPSAYGPNPGLGPPSRSVSPRSPSLPPQIPCCMEAGRCQTQMPPNVTVSTSTTPFQWWTLQYSQSLDLSSIVHQINQSLPDEVRFQHDLTV